MKKLVYAILRVIYFMKTQGGPMCFPDLIGFPGRIQKSFYMRLLEVGCIVL